MTEETITETPTIQIAEFLKEHKQIHDPREAHPIDEDILDSVCDTKRGPVLIEYDLAAIQAVAVREILPYDSDVERWITCHPQPDDLDLYPVENGRDREGTLHYYQAQSASFYDLLAMVHERYGHYIEVEHVEDIVEVHTRQFLRDVHGYEGDFGGQVPNDSIDKVREPTLSNAYNDPKPGEGVVNWDTEPENGHYSFTDARGLVIEEGTHPVDDTQHSIGLLSSKLDNTETRTDGDWTEGEAVHHLTQNYVCDKERARAAFERYRSIVDADE